MAGLPAATTAGVGEAGRDVGQRRQLEARSHHDTFDRLPALTMPVFICGGKYDGTAPVDNLEAIERAFPRVVAFLQGELGGSE